MLFFDSLNMSSSQEERNCEHQSYISVLKVTGIPSLTIFEVAKGQLFLLYRIT